ncbi:conserved hypothetical protein [Mesorhizobium metallidurans STM 2683]|uniref:Transmembrane anti-sigma factor n=2 Tax=Mesorhizobium metallidurans TaxID=489722 RepID=M5EWK4_9HYPH|nr:conserved hypothetical protein [Mesorhizobium metallidurans STM 2683]
MALDGEMPAEERGDFEAWLEANPEMKAKSALFADDMRLLRETFGGILDEPVPERLTGLLTGRQARPAAGLTRRRTVAAVAAIFVAGAVGGYLTASSGLLMDLQGEDVLAENAIAAHVTYTADQARTVEVSASDRTYLESWLSKRTGLRLVAPDLTAEGFELLGGRVLPARQGSAALLVYKDQGGTPISVYVTAEGEAIRTGTYTPAVGGPTAIYWQDRNFGCAIVGSLPGEHEKVGGHQAASLSGSSDFCRASHQRLKSLSSVPSSTRVRSCMRRWTPRGVHCICCFLAKRFAITWLTVDSTKAVETTSP